MSFFAYKNGEMQAEGVTIKKIAAQVGTPFYCYSAGALRQGMREFQDGMKTSLKGRRASVCYAMKANSNLAVIKLLGEMGASVTKVERPGSGDPFRQHPDSDNSPFFLAFNRNKRSLVLDYAQPEGLAVLHELIQQYDILVINVRPGTEEKIGIGAGQLQKLNPRLIHCSITGFGADGPYAKRPAFDGVGQTLSGLLSRFHEGDDPRVAGTAMCDSLTGIFACMGMLGALHERNHTGKGRKVEVNMLEVGLAFAIEPLTHYLVLGEPPPFFYRGSASQAYILRCKDGKRIGLHMSSPEKFWEGLAKTIERPDLLTRYPTRKQKMDHYEDIGRELAAAFATRNRDEWAPLLVANDVPFAPERTMDEVADDPQVKHLNIFNEMQHPQFGTQRAINRPWRFDGDNFSAYLPPPVMGQHSDDILAEAGVSRERIAALRNKKIL